MTFLGDLIAKVDLGLQQVAAQFNATKPFLLPTGALVPYSGVGAAPTGFLKAQGQVVSRTTYAALWAALHKEAPGTTVNGSTTVTIPSFTALDETWEHVARQNMEVRGPGIPAGSWVVSFNAATHTIVMSLAAGAGAGAGTIYIAAPNGHGDGSTTFALPDTSDRFVRDVGPVASGAWPTGMKSGSDTYALADHQHSAPVHAHSAPVHAHAMGAHTHDLNTSSNATLGGTAIRNNATATAGMSSAANTGNNAAANTGNSAAANTGLAGADTVDTLPAFVTARYLIKT